MESRATTRRNSAFQAMQGAKGYYRVRYEDGLLAKAMENKGAHLTVRELVGELGNAQALVGTGDLPPAEALRLVPFFADDPNRQIVAAASQIASVAKAPYLSPEMQTKGSSFIRKYVWQSSSSTWLDAETFRR